MSPFRMIAVCLMIGALPVSATMAQSVKTPPGVGPPGGLPGITVPSPRMPSAPSPSISLPPSAPEYRPPAVVVPPPPPPPERSRDAGGPEECDCYRTVEVPIRDAQGRILRNEWRRIFNGRSVACCPR